MWPNLCNDFHTVLQVLLTTELLLLLFWYPKIKVRREMQSNIKKGKALIKQIIHEIVHLIEGT